MPLTIAPGFSKTQFHVFFVAWLFTLSALISVVVPAFQSPDEFEHITRAYLLGQGKIILDAPVGQPSGGLIDTGLNDYMNQFAGLPFHPARKLTQEQDTLSREIRWTGDLVFRPALGMAYYFPATYLAGYFSSFFGLLGWLDTPFPGGQYKYFLFGLFVLGVCSIHYKELKTQPLARILLLLCAVSSLFIIFLAMLLTWTPHPAVVIEGIQGRYFLIPCLLVAYGASAYKSTSYSATFDSILLTLVFLFGLTNAILSMDLLLDRYFLQTK